MQYGDQAHFITDHEEISLLDKHYVSRSDMQETIHKDFKVYEKTKTPNSLTFKVGKSTENEKASVN